MSGNWHVIRLGIAGLDVGWMVDFRSSAEQAQSRSVVHSFDSQLAVVSVVPDIESTMLGQADKISHNVFGCNRHYLFFRGKVVQAVCTCICEHPDWSAKWC